MAGFGIIALLLLTVAGISTTRLGAAQDNLNTLATSAAARYAAGKAPTPSVQVQAQLHSYSTAYWWSAAFFGAGFLATLVLYRRGVPESLSNPSPEDEAAPV